VSIANTVVLSWPEGGSLNPNRTVIGSRSGHVTFVGIYHPAGIPISGERECCGAPGRGRWPAYRRRNRTITRTARRCRILRLNAASRRRIDLDSGQNWPLNARWRQLFGPPHLGGGVWVCSTPARRSRAGRVAQVPDSAAELRPVRAGHAGGYHTRARRVRRRSEMQSGRADPTTTGKTSRVPRLRLLHAPVNCKRWKGVSRSY